MERPVRSNYQRLSGKWVQEEGEKEGLNGRGTMADAGTRCGAQRQAADAGGRAGVEDVQVDGITRR